MDMLQDRGFHLEVSILGELVQQYHDTNQDRFTEMSEKIILSHLGSKLKTGTDVKNIKFHIYTN